MKAQPIAELILTTVKRSRLLSGIDLRAVIGIRKKVLDYRYKDHNGESFTHPEHSCSIMVEALMDDVWVKIYDRSYAIEDDHNEDQLMRVMLSDLIVEGLTELKKEYEQKLKQ